ncbi:MAG: cytidine deaminase [Sphaerochaetaceae bacterium]|jgi:cytidine deaminase
MIDTIYFDLDIASKKFSEVLKIDKNAGLIFVDELSKLKKYTEQKRMCVAIAPLEIQKEFRDKGSYIIISALDELFPFETVEGFNNQIRKLRAKEIALKARENAYAPYSKFKVGAALVSKKTKNIYHGCNVENVSYGATICAERSAILAAVAAEGAFEIESLVVVSKILAVPCALCLQVMVEFTSQESVIALFDLEGNKKEYPFNQLLPHPFNDFPYG